MGRFSWGVDGNGVCHCVNTQNEVVFCAFNSGEASIFCNGADMKKPLSIKEDSVVKVVFRNTEYIFNSIGDANLFKLGFNDAWQDKLERAKMPKEYSHGYQVGESWRVRQ